MKKPGVSTEDGHEQPFLYGIALADITVGIPMALTGILLIFIDWRIGYYLTGLASFWFLWANVMTTATSLRHEKPALTISWFVAFPFGAFLGLAYLIWSFLHFQALFGGMR